MKLRGAIQIAGVVNVIVGITMIAPLIVSYLFVDGEAWSFIYSIVPTVIIGAVMYFACRKKGYELNHREGFLVVAFAWVNASFFCSLPFILSGHFPSIVDAVFEGVSGITTTGSSILPMVEGLPESILFWRSMTHWMGGVGIVLISLAVLPLLGIGGMQLYKAEMSVVSSDKFAPRVMEMARSILAVYLIFSVVCAVLLKLGGMNIFDAVTHMFATVSTGGFSTKNSSFGSFGSLYLECVTMVFMILGATNFALHHRFWRERTGAYTKDSEFKLYIWIIVIATILVAINLTGATYSSFFTSLRYSSFQVVSIMTTTGFSSADYGAWTSFGQVVLLALMFVGGSIGSTTGSIKCIRILILVKMAYKEVYRLIHPHAVIAVKRGGKVIPPEVLRGVMGFTILYLLAFVLSVAAFAWMGSDPYTAIASVAANLSNVGPGLGVTGPASNYSMISDPGKWLLIFDMLLGRLEIYALFALFVPAFWRA